MPNLFLESYKRERHGFRIAVDRRWICGLDKEGEGGGGGGKKERRNDNGKSGTEALREIDFIRGGLQLPALKRKMASFVKAVFTSSSASLHPGEKVVCHVTTVRSFSKNG